MSVTDIRRTYATGSDIEAALEKMVPPMDGIEPGVVLLAALSLAFILQDPDIEPDDLTVGVKGASEWIALFLTTIHESGETPKELMN